MDEEQQNGSSLPSLFGEIEGVYPYITMALPSKTEFNLSLSLKKMELIHELRRAEAVARQRYQELCSERTVVEQFNKRSSIVSVASIDEVGHGPSFRWTGLHEGFGKVFVCTRVCRFVWCCVQMFVLRTTTLWLLFVQSVDLGLGETPNGVGGGGSPEEESSRLLRRRLASINDVSPVLKLMREGVESKVWPCSDHEMIMR